MPPSSLDLVAAQLRAVDTFHQARAGAERAASAAAATREARMDLTRRMEVLREEHRAIVERADAQLRDSVRLLPVRSGLRAVVAHRNEWFTGKVCSALEQRGVEVVSRVANGASAVGHVLAEQPDLLLVEDVLPMLSGLDVVREVRQYSPQTRIGAHVGYVDRAGDLLDAGAHGAWSRQVPPGDVGLGLLGLLREPQPV